MRHSNLFSLGALAGLLLFALGHCRQTHLRRLEARPRPIPEPLQVWEDEGGQNQMDGQPR